MKWLDVWRFLRGYGIITLRGCRPESASERLRAKNIPVWNMTRLHGGAQFRTTRQGAAFLENAGLRGAVSVRRGGLWALSSDLKQRPALWSAWIAALTLAAAIPQFVWRVDLQSVPAAYREAAQAVVTEFVPRFPVLRRTIDRDAMRDALLLSVRELSYAQARTDGVTLRIEAQEKCAAPQVFSKEETGDLVAPFDGVIESIAVTGGTAAVRTGDVVAAGQVLIRGEAGREGYLRSVRAQGKITARAGLSCEEVIPYETLETRTGESDRAVWIEAFGLRVTLCGFKKEFSSFQIEETAAQAIPGVRLCRQTRLETRRPGEEELYLRARQTAIARAAARLPQGGQIVDTALVCQKTANGVAVSGTLTIRYTDFGQLQEVAGQ